MISDETFSDQTIIITGSTRGIGAAIANRFGSCGANVIVSGRNSKAGQQNADNISYFGGSSTYIETDVRKPTQIRRLIDTTVDEFGGIDVLINNASIETDTLPQNIDLNTWDAVLETNFRAYWLTAKHAYPYLKESDSAAIVNVSSNHSFATQPKKFPYNAVKSGIDGMTRAMATAWGNDGIRVNGVNPGWTDVGRIRDAVSKEEMDHLEQIHPLGRIADPEEVANVVLFLASELASFVTGECVVVDGGRTAVLQDDLYVDDLTDKSD